MIILPLQWDRHSGPDAIGQHKLTFTLDESVATEFNPMQIKKGTQFIVMMIEVNSKEAEEFRDETPEESKERFRKRMNSLINQVAEKTNVTSVEYRKTIKSEFIRIGLIKESTTELDLAGYAQAIAILNDKLYERKKNTRN